MPHMVSESTCSDGLYVKSCSSVGASCVEWCEKADGEVTRLAGRRLGNGAMTRAVAGLLWLI